MCEEQMTTLHMVPSFCLRQGLCSSAAEVLEARQSAASGVSFIAVSVSLEPEMTHTCFHPSTGDVSSGPHVSVASTLSTEPFMCHTMLIFVY